MTNTRRLLVLGIDAASPDLLRQWAADGTMPTLARLMASGVVAPVHNVAGLYNGSAWPTFYTGLNPGEHGIYWIDRLIPGSYRIGPVGEADFAVQPALWEVLSGAGHRVLVLDVPVCRLSPDLCGVQVVEWGTHDHIFGHRTTPATLARRIRERVGAHPLDEACDRLDRTAAEYRDLANRLIAGARRRAELAAGLLRDEEWDFAIQVFSEAHCGGHQLWHYHDPAHPAADPAVSGTQGDLLREVYVAIDSALERILRDVSPDTTVMVVSLHGMAHVAGMSRLLPDVLQRLGVTATSASDNTPLPTVAAPGWRGLLKGAYRKLPRATRLPLYRLREFVARRALRQGRPINIDPQRSRCFAVPLGPMVGGIRFNLRGREPEGLLARGVEAGAFAEELTRELMALTDPATGRAAVRRVVRSAELFRGALLDQLPDLLVEWDLDLPMVGSTTAGSGRGAVIRLESPRVGLVEGTNTEGRTGEHRVDGLLVAQGPGLLPREVEAGVSVLDLAPTIARMMSCEMPRSDGAVASVLLA